MKRFRESNGDKYRKYRREYRRRNLEKALAQHRETRKRTKMAAFDAYGGALCGCCGEAEYTMLTIDHIHEDGAEHRNEINGGKGRHSSVAIYVWLRKEGYPPGFQVLCYNCNISKHRNKGVCAHKLR